MEYNNERSVRVINHETQEPICDYPSIKKCAQALYGGTYSGMNKINSLCAGKQKTTYCEKLKLTITIKYIN
jgi:hypothetical protein